MTSTPMNLSTMSDAELEAWREFYEGRETDEAREFMKLYWRMHDRRKVPTPGQHPNGTCECGTGLEWERVSGGYRLGCGKCKR